MAVLVITEGLEPGRRYVLERDCTILGRQIDCNVCLQGRSVSRKHAQVLVRGPNCYVEDLGSSNGTFLNGKRLPSRQTVPCHEGDQLTIGPYTFLLTETATAISHNEPKLIIREEVNAVALSPAVLGQDSAGKLQVVLEIARHLARNLDLRPLLDTLVEQLLRLLPQADRALVILCEEDNLVVRAQQARGTHEPSALPFSRTIVRKALDEGLGILSDDIHQDSRFNASDTLMALNLHSVLCVPLINEEGRRLGVVQLDKFRSGTGFSSDDLQLLATVGLQIMVALENAAHHSERLREQRLMQELAMARNIQQGFLAADLDPELFPQGDCDIFGRVYPARQVSGDLYDFFPVPDGRLAFLIGDVSGKGMPAALFMASVHTLCRHLAKEAASPARTLARLNADLVTDNPSAMFVTLLLGYYQPGTGQVTLASAGHPQPYLRRTSGSCEQVAIPVSRPLGVDTTATSWHDISVILHPEDMLVGVTDGFLEARQAGTKEMFGAARMHDVVTGFAPMLSLAECVDRARSVVETFTGIKELADDGTMLLLRRR